MKLTQTQARFGGAVLAVLAVLVAVGLAGPAVAQISDQEQTLDEFEEIAVEIDYSGSTDSTITITNSTGATVSDTTVSGSGGTITEVFNLDQGSYNVSVSSTDETAVNSYNVTTQSSLAEYSADAIELDDGETIVADVEFSTGTSALVEVENDTGSVVDSKRIDFSGTTEWRTVEFADLAAGNYTVAVNAEDTGAINQTSITTTSSGGILGGSIGGASNTQLLGFAAVVGGLIYAYREDYL